MTKLFVFCMLLAACSRDEPPKTATVEPLPSATAPPSPTPSPTPSASADVVPLAAFGGVTPLPRTIAETIQTMAPTFRGCYNRGLASDPTMQGDVKLQFRIEPSGSVSSVTKVGGAGLSSEVESCLIKRLQHASFDPPGTAKTVNLPLRFRTPDAGVP